MSDLSITSAQEQLRQAMAQHGLVTEDEIMATEAIQRFHVIDDKPSSKNGWYALHLEPEPWAVFGCFKRDVSTHWSNRTRPLTREETKACKLRSAAIREALEAERAHQQAQCKSIANRIWQESHTANPDHAYLVRKGIQAYGLRQKGEALVAPIRSPDQELLSLQFIQPDGTKKFLTGTPKRGNYLSLHFTAEAPERVLICEGVATGASLHQATSESVVVAFDAGNLLPVAQAIRAKLPDAAIIICADNDHKSAENRGVRDATAAAKAIDGQVAIPVFPNEHDGTDFNDLHMLSGLEAVRDILTAALTETTCQPTGQQRATERQAINDGDFIVNKHGVSFQSNDGPVWICSRLDVIAKTRDSSSAEWGRLLEWHDDDNIKHTWAMPMELLQSDGNDFRRELSRQGLSIASSKKARDQLSIYLNTWKIDTRARCVDRLGWQGNVYVTPTECIGQNNEVVVFQNAHAIDPAFSQSGTLDEWRNSIGRLSAGNSRLVFAISVSFAGALATLAGEDSGGFHLRGTSSSGKSTALKVAASVWGNPEKYRRLWRATANGLEGLASLHNDGTLILDELSQMSPHEVGDAAYMLANGQGKARAGRTGAARPAAQWRLLFLSAGEVSLSSMIASAGKKANAGQEIRLADIAADAGAGMGTFEALHGLASPSALADALSVVSSLHHGSAGMAWLNTIVEHRSAIVEGLSLAIKGFVERVTPAESSGQVLRVAKRFGLVAQAGEIASARGITGWAQGESTNAAEKCFAAWLHGFGGTGNREDQIISSQVRAFFERHGSSRFEDTNNHGSTRINNRAGFIREANGSLEYLVLPEVFKNEICEGLNPQAVEAFLCKRKWITPAKDRITQKPRILAAGGQPRVYVFTSRIWEEAEDEVELTPTTS